MKYTEEHEWLLNENGSVTVGITSHAASELGDLVFVELPSVGATLSKGDDAVVIESVKAASDILSPLDGEIVEINEAIVDAPGKISDDPEGAGWFFKIKPNDAAQIDEYMDHAAYQTLIS